MDKTIKDFVESKNITFIKNRNEKDIGKLRELALVKDLLPKDTCFGTFEEGNIDCSNCFLKDKCLLLKNHEDSVSHLVHTVTGTIEIKHTKKNKVITTEIKPLLEVSLLKPKTIAYKIAKLILESNDVAFEELIKKIQKLGKKEYSFAIAKIKFYGIKKILQNRCGLEINIITRKYLEIKQKN